MSYKTLLITEPGMHIIQVTLNRPEVRNAINLEMMQDLLHFWESTTKKDDIRCIIITGTPPAFCAGADLKARQGMDTKTWKEQHKVLQQAMYAMITCPIPIIAAVNGAAFGGGLEITLASDFAYASESAKFAQSETKLGIIPGAMGTQNLPRACGPQRAKELCFTGKPFDAKEALAWGIVNKVCKDEGLLSEVFKTAQLIAANAPLAIRQAKQAINIAHDLPIKKGYQFEIDVYNTLLDTEDRIEGVNAFNEKRLPRFRGK